MASTTQEAEDVLKLLIQTTWDTVALPANLFFDNRRNTPPSTDVVWGRLHIREQGSARVSLGGTHGRFRTTGTLFLQVFVRKGKGKETINTITTAIKEALEDATPAQLGNIMLRDTVVKPVGSGDKTYFQQNVETGFTYDRVT